MTHISSAFWAFCSRICSIIFKKCSDLLYFMVWQAVDARWNASWIHGAWSALKSSWIHGVQLVSLPNRIWQNLPEVRERSWTIVLIRAHAIVEAETYPLLTETHSQVHPNVGVWNMPETIIWNHPWCLSSIGWNTVTELLHPYCHRLYWGWRHSASDAGCGSGRGSAASSIRRVDLPLILYIFTVLFLRTVLCRSSYLVL